MLRDDQKTDAEGEKLASGIGFAEFSDESLAIFAIRYLNNMELVANKGLIVDYSLEDARALHQREKRLEKQKKISDERKKEQRRQSKADQSQDVISAGTIVDLGKKSKGEKQEKLSIDKITDLELLHKMKKETISRGKKQRIKKRIAALSGNTETNSVE